MGRKLSYRAWLNISELAHISERSKRLLWPSVRPWARLVFIGAGFFLIPETTQATDSRGERRVVFQ
jgi:hypothetical protein